MKNLKGIVYDCEIVNCIPPKDGVLKPEFTYCKGWHDFANMGISVIGTANLQSGELKSFASALEFFNFFDFSNQEINLIGFNSEAFDDNLILANGFSTPTDFDLLLEIRLAAYGSRDWQDMPEGFSYSLDKIARANGLEKTGHGALAPELWQQGKHQEVIDYCLNDCRITRELFFKFLAGELKDPNTQELLTPHQESFDKLIWD